MAAPKLAIKSLPASSGPASTSQKHFTLQPVQCIRKTSLVRCSCHSFGSHSFSLTMVVSQRAQLYLQCLLVVLVSSALVSLFSSKLQILGTGWASSNHSLLRFLKAAPELICMVVFREVWDWLSLL